MSNLRSYPLGRTANAVWKSMKDCKQPDHSHDLVRSTETLLRMVKCGPCALSQWIMSGWCTLYSHIGGLRGPFSLTSVASVRAKKYTKSAGYKDVRLTKRLSTATREDMVQAGEAETTMRKTSVRG